MKRLVAVILAAAVLLTCALAEAETAVSSDVYDVKAEAVFETGSMQFAMNHNGEELLDVAGLSRLPSLLFVMRAFDEGRLSLNDRITVSRAAADVGGPTAFITAGENINADALAKAAAMITAGDAIYALAEAAAGAAISAESDICALLTELGIGNGDFSLSVGKKVMCAADVCKIMAELAKSPTYTTFSTLKYDRITHENGNETELANPNKLLGTLDGCIGGSTGSSDKAGYCGAFIAKREDMTFVCTVIGAENAEKRAAIARDGINRAFASFENIFAVAEGDTVKTEIPVVGGMENSVNAVATKTVMLLGEKGTDVGVLTDIPESVTAPVCKGDIIGYAEYVSADGTQSVRVPLAAAWDVKKADIGTLLAAIFARWVHK